VARYVDSAWRWVDGTKQFLNFRSGEWCLNNVKQQGRMKTHFKLLSTKYSDVACMTGYDQSAQFVKGESGDAIYARLYNGSIIQIGVAAIGLSIQEKLFYHDLNGIIRTDKHIRWIKSVVDS